jgi:hypothetical protein
VRHPGHLGWSIALAFAMILVAAARDAFAQTSSSRPLSATVVSTLRGINDPPSPRDARGS